MTLGNLIGIRSSIVAEVGEWESADVVRIFPIWDRSSRIGNCNQKLYRCPATAGYQGIMSMLERIP